MEKKIISAVIAVFLVLAVSVSAWSETTTNYKMSMGKDQKVGLGETAKVVIDLTDQNGSKVFSDLLVKVSYDTSVLDFIGCDDPSVSVAERTEGNLVLTVYGKDRPLGSVCSLSFKGIASGEGKVSVKEAFADQKENAAFEDAKPVAVDGCRITLSVEKGKTPHSGDSDRPAVPAPEKTETGNPLTGAPALSAVFAGVIVSGISVILLRKKHS